MTIAPGVWCARSPNTCKYVCTFCRPAVTVVPHHGTQLGPTSWTLSSDKPAYYEIRVGQRASKRRRHADECLAIGLGHGNVRSVHDAICDSACTALALTVPSRVVSVGESCSARVHGSALPVSSLCAPCVGRMSSLCVPCVGRMSSLCVPCVGRCLAFAFRVLAVCLAFAFRVLAVCLAFAVRVLPAVLPVLFCLAHF